MTAEYAPEYDARDDPTDGEDTETKYMVPLNDDSAEGDA